MAWESLTMYLPTEGEGQREKDRGRNTEGEGQREKHREKHREKDRGRDTGRRTEGETQREKHRRKGGQEKVKGVGEVKRVVRRG